MVPLELNLPSIALIALGGYFYSKFPSKELIDKYPEHLKEIVQKIRSLIDREIYRDLTSKRTPSRPLIGTSQDTRVLSFSEVPEWVVKGSSLGFLIEIRNLLNDDLCHAFVGNLFRASNCEGGVCFDFFSLASRVQTAKKMRQIIKRHFLKTIVVPKKYLCSYPSQHISFFAMPFYNLRCFVLSQKCDVNHVGADTISAIKSMDDGEKRTLARELLIFLRYSGITDFHQGNFYIKDKKFVLFDTQSMKLAPLSRIFCISVPLKEARVNFENARRYFQSISETECIVVKCEKRIRQMHNEEIDLLMKKIAFLFIVILFIPFCLIRTLEHEYRG